MISSLITVFRKIVNVWHWARLSLLLFLPFMSGCLSPGGRALEVGPLYASHDDLHGVPGFKALGPLVEHRKDDAGRTFTAIRPFWSRTVDSVADRSVADWVWPLGSVKDREGEKHWRFLPAFGHDFDTESRPSRHRWTVFPVLFGGRTRELDPYFAVFPLGGTLHEFLGRDRIMFVMFPVYARSSIKDLQTHSVFWPIYSRTVGTGVYRHRVWPLYGISVNEGRWTKRFVAWPFWTSVRYHYPDQQGGGFVLFPLYGQVNVEDRRSRMVLPPLFKVEWDDHDHLAWNAPWPFLQYSRGNTDKLYVWPLYGQRSRDDEHRWFALWPLVGGRQQTLPKATVRRFHVMPLLQYESRFALERQAVNDSGPRVQADQAEERYFKLWPLFSYRRELDHARFRTLALWPLKQTPGIERNWAPWWSLWTHERAEDERRTEALWGVYRHQRDTESRDFSIFPLVQVSSDTEDASRRVSLLYGLLGYRRSGLQRSARLLYFLRFNWGTSEEETPVDQP